MHDGTTISKLENMVEARMCARLDCEAVGVTQCEGCGDWLCKNCLRTVDGMASCADCAGE